MGVFWAPTLHNANSSGSTVEKNDNAVKNKKAKLSEDIASGSSDPLKQQPSSPELPHKLPAKFRKEGNLSDKGSEEVSDGVQCTVGQHMVLSQEHRNFIKNTVGG